MKLSEFIEDLQRTLRCDGDGEVYVADEWETERKPHVSRVRWDDNDKPVYEIY